MNVHYTPEAINDLNRLREFISEKNPYAAQRIAGELLEGINKLSQQDAQKARASA
jgi:plasmid stabilization system protein ParE